MNGLKPIIEFMTFNFSLVAIDQVINASAKMLSMSGGHFSNPIVFRGPTGNAGQLGAQHSQNFENWYANTPGLKVVVPSNPYDAKGLLKQSILDPDPVIFMESEIMYGDKGQVPEEEYYLELGKAHVVKEGTDVTIVTFGKMLSRVVNPAVEELSREGINAEVIDLRTVRPIDYDTIINSVRKTNRLVIVEEAWPLGSIATEIAFKVQKDAFDYLDAPIKEALPNAERVVKAVKSVLYAEK